MLRPNESQPFDFLQSLRNRRLEEKRLPSVLQSMIDQLKKDNSKLSKQRSNAQRTLSSTRTYLYCSLALNAGLIAYCIFKR